MPLRHIGPLAVALLIIVSACGDSSVTGPAVMPSGPGPWATSSAGASPAEASPAAPSQACPSAEPASNGPVPWWRDAIFYEVFVRSFADSDGDGIGDLRGLTGRLDQLNDGDPTTTDDLGVTALWLMPIVKSPSYHGYDVVDYESVAVDYGTNADFKALVAAAHARGIRVIVDFEVNHTSIAHPWFQDSRTRSSDHDAWYVWSDTQPSVVGPGGRPVWHPDGGRWYYGYFWEGMPDLNLTYPPVTAALDDVAIFWLTEMGVDGFRLDAARHLIEDGDALENTAATFDWLGRFRDVVHASRTDALVLGEVWDATSMASRYIRENSLDLVFEFDLAAQMLLAVRSGNAGSLELTEEAVASAYPNGGYGRFLSNHDQDRTFDVVGQDAARARQAATLLLTGPGVPFVYYGEEIGLRGRKPDEQIRTPMPWTGAAPGFGFTSGKPWEPFAEGAERANVTAESGDPDSLLAHYRALIHLRSSEPALAGDARTSPIVASEASIHAVLRDAPGARPVVIVSNLADTPVDQVTLSMASSPLCGTVRAIPIFSTAPSDDQTALESPMVEPTGGFSAWSVGRLGPHEDLVIALEH